MNLSKLADSLQSDLNLIEAIYETIRVHKIEVTEDMIIEFWNGDGEWDKSHHEAAVITAFLKDTEDNRICWGDNTYTVLYRHLTGSVDTKEGWIESYDPEELLERGLTATEAFEENFNSTIFPHVDGF